MASEQQTLSFHPNPIVNISWFNTLSEPPRFHLGAKTVDQPFLYFHSTPIVHITWYEWLSEPPRFNIGMKPQEQQVLAFYPTPIVTFSYYEWLSEPPRFPQGLRPQSQQFIQIQNPQPVYLEWFLGLSEPPRFPKRLAAPFNPFHEFSNFVPLAYTAMLNVRETADLFLGVVWEYGTPVSAIVEVNEIVQVASPVGLIENNHVSANVTLYEPIATPSSGTPILGVASANVAIREV